MKKTNAMKKDERIRMRQQEKEDIIRMAKWSGFTDAQIVDNFYEIESFSTHVAEYERELCAKVCDERAQTKSLSNHRRCDADLLASAIRSRD
jgi:hypothetical protein